MKAPWSDDQVASLNAYQREGVFHPYTCGNNSNHLLEATNDGWVCPKDGCDYTQTWAHSWGVDWIWKPVTAP